MQPGAVEQTRVVHDDDATPVDVNQTATSKCRQRCVDTLPAAAGELSKLALGQPDDRGRVRIGLATHFHESHQRLRDAPRQVEQRLVRQLVGEPAHHPAELAQHPLHHLWLARHQLEEVTTRHYEQVSVLKRLDRRRPTATVDKWDLTEGPRRLDHRHRATLAAPAGSVHEDGPARDYIKRISRKPLRINEVTATHLAVMSRARQQLPLLQRQAGKQRHSAE